jgi:hypothetical protein
MSSSSAYEGVRAVRILNEVLGVPARIPSAVLWEEHPIRVASPGMPAYIAGPETLRKFTSGHCTADVFDKPAHVVKCASCQIIASAARAPMPGGTEGIY